MPPLPPDFNLETERCRLRAPAEADFPHVFSATRQPGFNDGMPWDPPATEAELSAPLQRNREAWAAGDAYSFTIERRTDATFLGRISIRRTKAPKVWNLGFWLHPRHQGRGFMTEATRAVIQFGFETLGADVIDACYATWNERSKNVLEAVGMQEVEYIPQGFQKRGAWVPEYRMQIDRTIWRKK